MALNAPVLVVDDDAVSRHVLSQALGGAGLSTVVVTSGTEALAWLATNTPALVLLDLVMPDLGGVRVIEELREDPELARIPVLVVTGHEEAVPDMRAQLGEDNVFLKPFAVGELLARVGAVTGGP